MNVWIFQTGEPLHIDGFNLRPMRAMNLAESLIKAGHSVTIWSSDFFHQEKRARTGAFKDIYASEKLRIILVPSPGYKRNIGLGRLIDHVILAFNLHKILCNTKSYPNVAFIGYPPIEFAYVAVKWLKRNAVPTMLDAKDQWPHIFVESFPVNLQLLARFILLPYFYLGKRVMRDATALCSMTPNFLDWMRRFSGRENSDLDIVVPLSPINHEISDLNKGEAIAWWSDRGVKSDGRRRIFFIGSLSRAFDFNPVIVAAKYALENGLDWQFVLCGDGEKAPSIKESFAGIPNVIFPGWVDRSKSVTLADMSAVALAPYRNTDNFISNLPNKIIDYLSLGKPIASPLDGNVRDLIVKCNVGISYDLAGQRQLVDQLIDILNDSKDLQEKSENALRAYEQIFSGEMVYCELVRSLERLAVY